MRKLLMSNMLMLGLLAACSDDVPKVVDPHNPTVNGRTMKSSEFFQTYCRGKPSYENATCQRVKAAMAQDAARPNIPKGW